jgi:hypothetical protein
VNALGVADLAGAVKAHKVFFTDGVALQFFTHRDGQKQQRHRLT